MNEYSSIPDPSVYLHGFHKQHTSTGLCLWMELQEQLDGAHSWFGSFVYVKNPFSCRVSNPVA